MTETDGSMSATTTTISDFLVARIAEDEAVASEDAELTIWGNRPNLEQSLYTWGNDYGGGFGITESRMLAECEAKRWLIDIHRMVKFTDVSLGLRDVDVCQICHGVLDFADDDEDDDMDRVVLVQRRFPCPTIRTLASVYADHPDYQQEWRL